MEILILSALALIAWLFKRSRDERARLSRLESLYQGQIDYLTQNVSEQQKELTRLREMALELLRAQTTLSGRVSQLLTAPPEVRQLAPPPSSGPAATFAPPGASLRELAEGAHSPGGSQSAVAPPSGAEPPWASQLAQAAARQAGLPDATAATTSSSPLEVRSAAKPWPAEPTPQSPAEAKLPPGSVLWPPTPAQAQSPDRPASGAAASSYAAAATNDLEAATGPPEERSAAPSYTSVGSSATLPDTLAGSSATPTGTPAGSSAASTGAPAGSSAAPADWPPPLPSTPPELGVPLAAAAHVPAEPAAPPKLTPSFDWETLLGVRGAAWLGAVALVIAGTLFAKYSIENGLISPSLRIAFLVLLGVASLGSSEFLLRPRYATTADALCGGGVAILYAALFAAHNLYHLMGLIPTFALMALTTLTAALLALRYGNMYIAVLGMLGGFVTPLTLSTGQDRPFGLFGYILMLDLGFLGLAVRRGWHRLALINLVATLLMEAGWAGEFLTPDKMPIAVGVALVFAFLFLALPWFLRNLDDKQRREILYGSAIAGLLPFGFAWVLAAHAQYAQNWPLLFGFVACLELGLLGVAVRRWSVLALLAVLATAATHALWDMTALGPKLLPVAVGSALLLGLPFWGVPALWRRLNLATAGKLPEELGLAAALGASGPLVLFCALAGQSEYGSRWALLFLGMGVSVMMLLWLALRLLPVVAVTTAGLTVVGLVLWVSSTLQPALLAPGLGMALAMTLLFLLAVALAPRLGPAGPVPRLLVRGAEIAVLAALGFDCWLAAQPEFGARWALVFGALACANGCVLWLGLRHSRLLIRLGLGLTILCHALWIGTTMSAAQMPLAMGLVLLFGLPYLALPTLKSDGAEAGGGTADATLAAVAPFGLAFYLASTPGYAGRWALLFGFVAILDGVLVTMALWRRRAYLLLVAAAATSITQMAWAETALHADTLWGGTLSTLALAAALGATPRLWAWRAADQGSSPPSLLPEWAGIATLVGLVMVTGQVAIRGLGQPPWAFLLLLALATGLLIERTRRGTIAWTAPIGALVLAVLVQGWFGKLLPADSKLTELLAADVLLRNLSVPLLLAAVLSVAAALRTSRQRSEPVGAGLTAAGPPAKTDLSITTVSTWAQVASDSELGALGATLTAMLGLTVTLSSRSVGSHPGLLFTALLLLDVLVLATVARQHWTWLGLLALGITATAATLWQQEHFQPSDGVTALSWLAVLHLFFLTLPLMMLRVLPALRTHRSLFFTSALAGPLLFLPLYLSWVGALGRGAIGILPVLQAALSLAALAFVQTLPQPGATAKLPAEQLARRDLGHRALLAATALGFLATAIPLQLDRQWIAVAWALEAAAVWWLYRRLPHPGLKYFGLGLYVAVALRLIPTVEVLHYHQRGLPVLNWLLYSYGVPCVCFLVGAAGLREVEARYRTTVEKNFPIGNERIPLHAVVSFAGLALIFVLLNLEIADAFSPGQYTELWLERGYARDLTRSLAWGVYAVVLLITGMRRDSKALRYFSLGALVLTIGKVFIWDLSSVGGIYRPLSLLGLAASLILVSLLYQRFVFKNESKRQKSSGTGTAPPAAGPPKEPPKGASL